jgi:uncharacterized membrane protein
MSATATVLLVVHLLSAAIWIGGIVTLYVVGASARSALDDVSRVAFFRALGRRHGAVATPALMVALVTGGVLAGSPAGWSGWVWAALALALAMLAVTGLGVAQARSLSRLRTVALDVGAADPIHATVRSRAANAVVLRGAIALLTLLVVILGAQAVD